MRIRISAAILVALVASATFAQVDFNAPIPGAGASPAAQQVSLSGSIGSRTGETVTGTVIATVANGWHVNSNKPLDSFVIPTVLTLRGRPAFAGDGTGPKVTVVPGSA